MHPSFSSVDMSVGGAGPTGGHSLVAVAVERDSKYNYDQIYMHLFFPNVDIFV